MALFCCDCVIVYVCGWVGVWVWRSFVALLCSHLHAEVQSRVSAIPTTWPLLSGVGIYAKDHHCVDHYITLLCVDYYTVVTTQ